MIERRSKERSRPCLERVLIVDDNPDDLMKLKKTLADTVRVIDTCSDLDTCKTLIRRNKYEFVFLDVVLPDGNGFTEKGYLQGLAGDDTTILLMSRYGSVFDKNEILDRLNSTIVHKELMSIRKHLSEIRGYL